MNPDDAKAGETREWLDKASEDLASARVLAGAGHYANALFFCQQAAEKSLKAFLTWHERPFRRTHDLEELGRACVEAGGVSVALLEEADVLSDYAWKLRYPGTPYAPGRAETEAMLNLAQGILAEIEARLSELARAAGPEEAA